MLRIALLAALLISPAVADASIARLPGSDRELREQSGKAMQAEFLRELMRAECLHELTKLRDDTEKAIGRELPGPWRIFLMTGVWPKWAPPPKALPDLRPNKPVKKRPWWAIP